MKPVMTQDLLEAHTLVQKGIGAETILQVLGPLLDSKKQNLLARLAACPKEMEAFLELQAEAKIINSILSELRSIVTQAETVSKTSGVAFKGRNP